MPSLRTEITEIVTGLGLLGLGDVDWALAARPAALAGVSDEHWDRLAKARAVGLHDRDFASAWANGVAFLGADDGLRGRPPRRVEWKGPDKPPGYDLVPADLRVDHVWLISCKYLSKILLNASPAHLFDRVLGERRGTGADWYLDVAPGAYRALYREVCAALGDPTLPADPADLGRAHREVLKTQLTGQLPAPVAAAYQHLADVVSQASADRWRRSLADLRAREEMLWRLLRLSSAPYFVLGSAPGGASLRLRIATPWDWRQRFTLRAFDVWGEEAGQPKVVWRANVTDRLAAVDRTVGGHVEVRWSHGRFSGQPEAKVYLDTPHDQVPGYLALDGDHAERSHASAPR
ncbi:MAG: hypothetical protein JWN46_1446 [Acidimicrobiales bacterium]|nr:hypothetical protein [Acidimicrobiales bacterium]